MNLSRTKKALYGNLRTSKMRRRHGLFTVEGLKAVEDTAGFYEPMALICVEGTGIADNLRSKFREVYEITASDMKSMSSFTTPSEVMGVFRIPEPRDFEIDHDKLYVLLDGVRDPGNLGTIIRTCHWFGVYTVLASHDCVDCYNPKVVQASMGSLGAVNVIYTDLQQLIRSNQDMPLYGTLLEGEDIFKADLSPRGFIVMGNEGSGLSDEIRSMVKMPLTIPPATDNHGESLNVAIATAIVLSQIVK